LSLTVTRDLAASIYAPVYDHYLLETAHY